MKYFDTQMVNRQRLLWTLATRRQLERWEPMVAAEVLSDFDRREIDPADIWTAEVERHFALVAARNLLRALELEPPSIVAVEPTMRAELREGRDLVEHWSDNMPAFHVHVHGKPRSRAPRPSGRSFAERNPRDTPYDGGWSSTHGAELLPNVPARALHELLDAVEAEVLASDAELARFVPPRAPSPWVYDEQMGWWPKRPE